jgi:hypothetical protein
MCRCRKVPLVKVRPAKAGREGKREGKREGGRRKTEKKHGPGARWTT